MHTMQERLDGHGKSTDMKVGPMDNHNRDTVTIAYSTCEGLAILLTSALLGCSCFDIDHMFSGSVSLCCLVLAGNFSTIHSEASNAAAAAKVNGALQKHCSSCS